MPLLKGKKNIGRNISELERSGRPVKQAQAIAIRVASDRKKHKGHINPKHKAKLIADAYKDLNR
jgi:hypothetical protein